MYGKHFASMYSGSLFGKPAIVFAVMGFVISNMRPSRNDGECYVEINPTMLAATFSTSAEQVHEALIVLESADPASRTKTDDGRRLVLLEPQRSDGPMQYRVVNGAHYRAMRDEEERRAYLRDAKRAERSRKRGVVNNVNNVNRGQPRSTQAEVEVEVEESLLSDVRRTSQKVFPAGSIELELSELLFSLLQRRNPKHKQPDLQKWAHHVDLMIREDGLDPSEIRRIIEWSQSDEFWQVNIRSTEKLRAQFDQLVDKSKPRTRGVGHPTFATVPLGDQSS